MSHRAAVHDLKSLILSFHSLIAIETVEEERFCLAQFGQRPVALMSAGNRLPISTWS